MAGRGVFWKPGAAAPWELDRDNAREQETASRVVHNPRQHLALSQQRSSLPIAQQKT